MGTTQPPSKKALGRSATIIRAILFCLLCAIVLAISSGLLQNLPIQWNQHIFLTVAVIITYSLTLLFTKWEKLRLKDVGVAANKATWKKIAIGFAIGLLMALLQPTLMLLLGHYSITITSVPLSTVVFYLTLYILVAIREELAFRGYPLFSLNHTFGLWPAQFIIFIIFSIEHVAGGMTWPQAFIGPGTGALLFGLAALRTKGIAVPIGIHTAWNFGQWCLGFKKEPGIFHSIIDKGFEGIVERNGWASYLVIMAFAILCFYYYKPKNKNTQT